MPEEGLYLWSGAGAIRYHLKGPCMMCLSSSSSRSHSFLAAAASYAEKLYSPDGRWIGSGPDLLVRERYWLALALYATGRDCLADAIIRAGDLEVLHTGQRRTDGSTFEIFHSNIAVMCLRLHASKMAPDVRTKMTDLVAEAVGPDGGDRKPEYQFHGYNDNMPAKATMGLIIGGEMLGMEDAVAHGIWNLKCLRNQLVRRGTISEYNSPTYTAATIHPLNEIARLARSNEARIIARGCVDRLWNDLASRFHSEIGVIAGPYSRAYTVDTLASLSGVSALLWLALGDIARPSPMLLFERDPDLFLHHAGDRPFNIAQVCWFASGEYDVPEPALRLFQRKDYPFTSIASCEMGDFGPDFPAASDTIYTYMRSDYTVGTSGKDWLDSAQGAPYFVTYKQKADVCSYRDVGTVFSKFVLDDEVPGMASVETRIRGAEQDNLANHASSLSVQSASTVMMLTHPHLSLGIPSLTSHEPPSPRRLSEIIVFPSRFAGADEIAVGGAARRDWGGSCPVGSWIGCRRGRLLIAFLPLVYTADFDAPTISLQKIGSYEVIRSTFYDGPARTFSRDELQGVCGGFIAEHASVDDYVSLADFMSALTPAFTSDYFYRTRRARYVRPALANAEQIDIEVSWSPSVRDARYVAVNGQVRENVRTAIDGVSDEDLPFLNGGFSSSENSQVPYEPFGAAWARKS